MYSGHTFYTKSLKVILNYNGIAGKFDGMLFEFRIS
jgi:hypothetical protein